MSPFGKQSAAELFVPQTSQCLSWRIGGRGSRKKDNSKNTVAKALRVLKTFYRKGQKEGIISRDEYIWNHIPINREEGEKDLPSAVEMEALVNLWDEWKTDSESHPKPNQWRTLAYFLNAYYAGGMRFGDVAFLE